MAEKRVQMIFNVKDEKLKSDFVHICEEEKITVTDKFINFMKKCVNKYHPIKIKKRS